MASACLSAHAEVALFYSKGSLTVLWEHPRGDEVVAVFRESNSLENEGPQTYPKLR